ncbi:hypothetical protein [Rothia mucilaginosa]|uniref:hypothetical protein n=1 Tax=Rothia mucilaginosa TaxID=43675 RepID=UPI00288A7115|nr:hypothetical protein [Rothia mucilaginosa]
MTAEIQQSNQKYVATVEVLQPNGEWVVVARAVDSLEGLAEWASNGVGVGSSRSFDALDHFSPESTMWTDECHDLVTDEKGNVVEPADDIHAPYGYLHWGEGDYSDEVLAAKSKELADSGVRLLRLYPSVGQISELSKEYIQETIEESDEYSLVLAHPEPLEYSVENVAAYFRYAFGLDDEKERLTLAPATKSEFRTMDLLGDYAWANESGELSEEDAQDWERVSELYFRHPYARKNP